MRRSSLKGHSLVSGPRRAEALLGKRVGDRYRILRALGQGGMGAVYEAVHEQTHHRAAVKILFPEFSSQPRWVERLFKEAHAVNLASHPGLVKIFSCGQADDLISGEHSAYIIMEYLDGESLWRRLARLNEYGQRLPVGGALRVARQVASALSCVHEKGIIHRDLKPENVLLVPDPEVPGGERTKLVDFGIAKFDETTNHGHHTTGGKVMGTPVYMSPEQCRGVLLSGKCDVYSLGIMLYEMLTGRPPFDHDEPGMVMTMHIRDQPPPLLSLRKDIPAEVVALVDEMLRKEGQDRPAMVEIEDRIEHLEEQAPPYAPLPSPALAAPADDEDVGTSVFRAVPVGAAAHSMDRKGAAARGSLEWDETELALRPRPRGRGLIAPLGLSASIVALILAVGIAAFFPPPRRVHVGESEVVRPPAQSPPAPGGPLARPAEPPPSPPTEQVASDAEPARPTASHRRRGIERKSALRGALPRLPPPAPLLETAPPGPVGQPVPAAAGLPAASPPGPARRRRGAALDLPAINDLSPAVPPGG